MARSTEAEHNRQTLARLREQRRSGADVAQHRREAAGARATEERWEMRRRAAAASNREAAAVAAAARRQAARGARYVPGAGYLRSAQRSIDFAPARGHHHTSRTPGTRAARSYSSSCNDNDGNNNGDRHSPDMRRYENNNDTDQGHRAGHTGDGSSGSADADDAIITGIRHHREPEAHPDARGDAGNDAGSGGGDDEDVVDSIEVVDPAQDAGVRINEFHQLSHDMFVVYNDYGVRVLFRRGEAGPGEVPLAGRPGWLVSTDATVNAAFAAIARGEEP